MDAADRQAEDESDESVKAHGVGGGVPSRSRLTDGNVDTGIRTADVAGFPAPRPKQLEAGQGFLLPTEGQEVTLQQPSPPIQDIAQRPVKPVSGLDTFTGRLPGDDLHKYNASEQVHGVGSGDAGGGGEGGEAQSGSGSSAPQSAVEEEVKELREQVGCLACLAAGVDES